MKSKRPTKTEVVKQVREEILAKYPHLEYVGMFRGTEGHPHLLFSTSDDNDFDLTAEIAARLDDIHLETGHCILAGVYTEEDLGVKKRE